MRYEFTIPVLVLSLLVISLTACGARISLQTDASKVDAIAAEIADFEPPTGYSAEFSASYGAYTAAAYSPGDHHSHLYLIQSSDDADGDNLAAALARVEPGTHDRATRMTTIETKSVTVRGNAATLIISEGTNSEGETYRQAMVGFTGKGGPALLVRSEPVDRWDQQSVEAFIASIR